MQGHSRNLLTISNLIVNFHVYQGIVKAVRDVSFSISKGKTIGLVGESGCGKSVTALSILKLISSSAGKIQGGRIVFEQKNLLECSETKMKKIRGKKIAMIFQDAMTALNPTLTIGTQIVEMMMAHCKEGFWKKLFSKKRFKDIAIEKLKLVGIDSPHKRFYQYPHELSGGMRQRAMIAVALSCGPQLLIADEPTTALDTTMQAQILDLLKSIQSKTSMSIMMITHDLGVVANMCEEVVVMYAGKVVEIASVEEIFYNPMHPYTKGLLQSMPRLDKEKDVKTIPGLPPDLFDPPQGCSFYPRCKYAMKICTMKEPKMQSIDISSNRKSACWLFNNCCKQIHEEFLKEKI